MISLETPQGNGPHLAGGEKLLDFLEWQLVLLTYDGDPGFPLANPVEIASS